MTKLFGVMVMKNEEHRYLEKCLEWASSFLDEIFIFDDRSTDNSVDIASRFATVAVRPESSPSFLEDESLFRSEAWRCFEDLLSPSDEDWVLTFDSDEFLYSALPLYDSLMKCTGLGSDSVKIHFLEVFGVDGGSLSVRIDPYWDSIFSPRFFRFQGNASWPSASMACGSEPLYARKNPANQFDIKMLHFGYAKEEDRLEKYNRYISRPGHSISHIKSILSEGRYDKYPNVVGLDVD
jgi:glycosyltransferase involved in cell wall biosynthesis